MADKPDKRRNTAGVVFLVAALACAGVFVAVNWTTIGYGLAALFAEQRPELLRDANWEDPASARAFLARFPAGSKTSELVTWLKANRFEIDALQGKASRLVAGFPCNEIIEITWTADSSGNLVHREALIPPGGCL